MNPTELAVGQAYFWVCAATAVAGAMWTVLAKNPIRGAMGLLLMILSIAGLFLSLHAQFLAAIQLIVYAGAIVVLFLFVIMLLGPSAQTPRDGRGKIARYFGGGLFALGFAGAGFLVVRGASASHPASGGPWGALPIVDADFGGIDKFGQVLF